MSFARLLKSLAKRVEQKGVVALSMLTPTLGFVALELFFKTASFLVMPYDNDSLCLRSFSIKSWTLLVPTPHAACLTITTLFACILFHQVVDSSRSHTTRGSKPVWTCFGMLVGTSLLTLLDFKLAIR
tara:strand:- start:3380 stop:3763 length:384 start_codon:yes stop_codon:yes gene_type:complete